MANPICISLSTEILQIILESLDGQAEALAACCLASQTLCAISQPSLFCSVDLGPVIHHSVLAFFAAIIGNPHPGTFVTTFGFGRCEFSEPVLPTVFPLLRNVRWLKFGCEYMHWGTITTPVHQGLQGHLFPDIERISIVDGIEIPLSSLCRACPKLTHLMLFGCDTAEDDYSPDMDTTQIPHPRPLRSLTIENSVMSVCSMKFFVRAQITLERLVIHESIIDTAGSLFNQLISCLRYLLFGVDCE